MNYHGPILLKVTLGQQLRVLIPFLFSNFIIFFGFSIIFRGQSVSGAVLWVYLAAIIVSVLPVLVLHIQYLINNYNLTVNIYPDLKVIELRKGASIQKYSFDDIKALDYYATVGHISKRGASTAFYSFDSYRFYRLEFADKKVYYFTCLLMNNIEYTLENLVKTEADWHFRALPLIY